MRLLLSTAVLAAVVVLGGCGSSGPKSNGVADKTPAEILTAARAAAAGATSVHVSGSGSQGGTTLDLNLYLAAGKGGKGHMSVNGLAFDIVRVGSTAYFKGDKKFWSNFGGGTMGELLKGRWLSEPSGTGDLASLSSLTDIQKLVTAILGSHGTLEKGATSTVNGTSVIALKDTAKNVVLYVSTTGEPYPIELASATGEGNDLVRRLERARHGRPAGELDRHQQAEERDRLIERQAPAPGSIASARTTPTASDARDSSSPSPKSSSSSSRDRVSFSSNAAAIRSSDGRCLARIRNASS